MMACLLAASGKAVFCEKPLAKSVSSVIECYKLAEQLGLPLMCGFNRYIVHAHPCLLIDCYLEILGNLTRPLPFVVQLTLLCSHESTIILNKA